MGSLPNVTYYAGSTRPFAGLATNSEKPTTAEYGTVSTVQSLKTLGTQLFGTISLK